MKLEIEFGNWKLKSEIEIGNWKLKQKSESERIEIFLLPNQTMSSLTLHNEKLVQKLSMLCN